MRGYIEPGAFYGRPYKKRLALLVTRERNTWDGKAINTTRLINSASGILRNGRAKNTYMKKNTVLKRPRRKRKPPTTAAVHDGGGMHFQWLRAAVLGASDDLVSTASLMLGIGAACPADERAVLLSGLAGLVAVAWPSASRFFRLPSAAKQRAHRAPGTVTGDGHRLVLLSPATASGTTSPLPLLLAHNSHMFTGERGILTPSKTKPMRQCHTNKNKAAKINQSLTIAETSKCIMSVTSPADLKIHYYQEVHKCNEHKLTIPTMTNSPSLFQSKTEQTPFP
uniref:Vacuolar iron transporter n=1 Tax=Oryza nivara TaxID=4536 RepID=A0A0E0HTY2_ORYNI